MLFQLLLILNLCATVCFADKHEFKTEKSASDESLLEHEKEHLYFAYNPEDDPPKTHGLLYPYESESREVRTLDGIWKFLKSDINNPLRGVREKWYERNLDQVEPTIPMPVPASYNDITTESVLRDHIGTVWYERTFFIPHAWALDQRVWLRFGSVHYAAIVWLNGIRIAKHTIGHLPFEAEITHNVLYGAENRLTVLCDNTLLNTTIPQGRVVQQESDYGVKIVQTYTFDFFNYAGIHRSVHLYTTPKVYIKDVKVTTDLKTKNLGLIDFTITTDGLNGNEIYDPPVAPLYLHVQLRNRTGDLVEKVTVREHLNMLNGTLMVKNVTPWWPYLMHAEPAYLYTLELYLHGVDNSLLDVYRLKVGIRKLAWNNNTLLLNDKPVYFRGFGRHEDADIRGKGLDLALLTRDFNLLKWIGANAYRTSHYPYSEESMQFADEHGIMIIDECSSVNTDIFEPMLLLHHKSALEQLIHRDRNHPSVVMWSVANEPRSNKKQANEYFRLLTNYTKRLDPQRPITAAINVDIKQDQLAQYLDIISFNRYNAWYHNAGELDMITYNVIKEATLWHATYNKPVLMTEYGADTMVGLHFLPIYIWSEDYQTALISKHFQAFDILRAQNWFIGEFIWNFADFKTEQTYTRAGGNKKGVFTRNRQPKQAAHLLRERYYSLCIELDGCSVPDDIFTYVIHWKSTGANLHNYDEL